MEFRQTLASFDDAFRRGDADAYVSHLAADVRLLLHHQPPKEGRAVVMAFVDDLFRSFDTSAYEPVYETIEEHEASAYVMGDFKETLRPKSAGLPSIVVPGRIVLFWRRGDDGSWRVRRILSGRSAPEEELPA